MLAAEKRHQARVRALGCVVCVNEGHGYSPASIHHIKVGCTGIGRKSGECEVIPLCPLHHQDGGVGVAYHAAPKTWERRYGTQVELLAQVERMLLEQVLIP